MIYIYGLSAASQDSLTAALDGVPALQNVLQCSEMHGWTLLHSDHDGNEILPKRRHLLAHTRVLECAMACGGILPARFGLVANNLSQTNDIVIKNSVAIKQSFKKTKGAMEIGLRVQFARPAAIEAAMDASPELQSARAFLAKDPRQKRDAIAAFGGKLAEHLDRRRGVAQRQLIANLASIMRDYVLRAPEADTEVLRVECLVEADGLADFEAAVVKATKALDFAGNAEPAIQVIGPAPCYNFVALNLTFETNQEAA